MTISYKHLSQNFSISGNVLVVLFCFHHLSANQYSYPYQPWLRRNEEYQHFRRSADEYSNEDLGSARHFKPDTIFKITETLGALNTVGRYLVNMTRNKEATKVSEEVPNALYTISKNVLGRNVTDTIAPLVREALPLHEQSQQLAEKVDTKGSDDDDDDDNDEGGSKTCTTPEGLNG